MDATMMQWNADLAMKNHEEVDCGDASRRALLRAAFAAPIALAAARLAAPGLFESAAGAQAMKPATQKDGPHQLPPLPYSYGALNEAIDARTMRTHHGKHHRKYVDDLNLALPRLPAAMRTMTPQALLQNLSSIGDESLRDKVRNNAGGHVNHSMFWAIMSPSGGGAPTGEAARAINGAYGSFDRFKAAFNSAGLKRFGSGWVWLVADKRGAMKIITTPNQDNPLLMGLFPVMGNDVWEARLLPALPQPPRGLPQGVVERS
jgi:Fe-Mn family superoxide dismutase